MSSQSSILAAVKPDRQIIFRGSAYLMAFVFYGPLAMAALLPFGLPQKHPAYYVMYCVSVLASLALMHWAINKMLNGCYFTLTVGSLELGQNPKTVIQIADIVDVIPIAYSRRLFWQPKVITSPTRFNILLLRLRDGSRLPLAPVSNVKGFDKFFAKLYEVLKPMLKESCVLSVEDIAAMRQGHVNTLQARVKK